jgi:hypothetical protein
MIEITGKLIPVWITVSGFECGYCGYRWIPRSKTLKVAFRRCQKCHKIIGNKVAE